MNSQAIQFSLGAFLLILANPALSQFQDSDFHGVWNGTYSWSTFGGGSTESTLSLQENGQFTESSFNVYGTLYPSTNMWEYTPESNWLRLFWVSHIYNGQPSYTQATFFVVELTESTMELVYTNEYGLAPAAGHFIMERSSTMDLGGFVGVAAAVHVVESFNLLGQKIPSTTQGAIIIQRMSDGTIRKVHSVQE